MSIKTKRNLCTTSEAAEVFGVSMCRIRQMWKSGDLWSDLLGDRARVFDRDEVERKAAEMAKLRAGGHVRGPAPGGFRKDRPGKTRKKGS